VPSCPRRPHQRVRASRVAGKLGAAAWCADPSSFRALAESRPYRLA